MHQDVGNIILITKVKEDQEKLIRAKKNQHISLQQIAKLTWLRCGDENTKIFSQALKSKRYHNIVHAIFGLNVE